VRLSGEVYAEQLPILQDLSRDILKLTDTRYDPEKTELTLKIEQQITNLQETLEPRKHISRFDEYGKSDPLLPKELYYDQLGRQNLKVFQIIRINTYWVLLAGNRNDVINNRTPDVLTAYFIDDTGATSFFYSQTTNTCGFVKGNLKTINEQYSDLR